MTRVVRARQTVLAVAILGARVALAAGPYDVEWIKQFGTADFEFGMSVGVDADRNVYLLDAAISRSYLRKYSPDGAEQWAKEIGLQTSSGASNLTVTPAGTIYVTGTTLGQVSGPNIGQGDAFLMTFDSAGNPGWARQFGTMRAVSGSAIAVNAQGRVFVAGNTTVGGAADPATNDVLIYSDDIDGFSWQRAFGAANATDTTSAVAADQAGNSYFGGYTRGDLVTQNLGPNDAILFKYDASGNHLWAKQFGTAGSDFISGAVADAAGDLYIAGRAGGSLLGPPLGKADALLMKFNGDGDLLWGRQFGTAEGDAATALAFDPQGNIVVAGQTSGNLGGANAGDTDAFLSRFDPLGNLLGTTQFGSAGSDSVAGLTIDSLGYAYVVGTTNGDLGAPAAGHADAFLVKLAPVPEPSAWILAATALTVMAMCRSQGRRRRATQQD